MRLLRPRNIVLAFLGIVLLLGLALALLIRQTLSAPLGLPGKYAADFRALMLEGQPAEGEDGWPRVVELQAALDQLDRKAVPEGWPEGERPIVDWTLLYAPEAELRDKPEERPAAIAGLRRGLASAEAAAVDALLARIAAAPRFVRSTPEGRAIDFFLPELGMMRRGARFAAARYAEASARGEGAAQAAALERGLALGRAASAGTSLIDRLVGIAVHALMFQRLRAGLVADAAVGGRLDDATLAAMQAAIERQALIGDASRALRGERLLAMDTVEWTHTDDGRGDGRLAVDANTLGGGMIPTPAVVDTETTTRLVGLFAPTKRETLKSLESFYEMLRPTMALPVAERAAAGDLGKFVDDLPAGQILLKMLLPVMEKSLQAEAQVDVERSGTRLMLAIERHRLRHGGYPAALAALAPEFIPEIPRDMVSGKPWGYRLLTGDPAGRGYLLYSAGGDGVDDGGVPASGDAPVLALVPGSAPGSDYVLNSTALLPAGLTQPEPAPESEAVAPAEAAPAVPPG